MNYSSTKDMIAHLAGWSLRVPDQLAALGRGEGRPDADEIDADNALIWSEYYDRSWE